MAGSLIGRLSAIAGEQVKHEEGQGLVEYAFILLLVAVAAVGTLTVFGTSVSAMFTTVTGAF